MGLGAKEAKIEEVGKKDTSLKLSPAYFDDFAQGYTRI